MKNFFAKKVLVLLTGIFLVGCNDGETLMKEIRYHSEDATLRAKTMLSEDSSLAKYRDHKGQTPLHAAANYCNIGALNRLLEEGADPNVQDVDGNTALHLALDPQIIKDFIEQDKDNFILLNRLGGEQEAIISALKGKTDLNLANKAGVVLKEQFYESATEE